MNSNEVVPVMLAAAVPLFIIVIGIVGTLLSAAANKLASYLKDKSSNEMLDYAITAANDVVQNTVRALNQTIVDDLKAAATDGRLTEEEIKQISSSALHTVKATLSKDILKSLEDAYDDIDLYLSNLIEAEVDQAKKEVLIVQ